MYPNTYFAYPYLFAALSLAVFVLTGLLINNRQQRATELKTIALFFLIAPMVLQGVWLVIMVVHIGLHFPFYMMDWQNGDNKALPFGMVFSLLAGLLLLGGNILLWRLALPATSRLYRRCWQALGFVLGCCLLVNLVLNYFWHGWGQRAIALWADYGNGLITGPLLLMGVTVWLLLPRWARRAVQ
jgi:hypothetical protein